MNFQKHSSSIYWEALVVATLSVICPIVVNATNIDTVTVGNPGNAPDTRYGLVGEVDNIYNIGKYEVTAGQYTAFLNAVAATDSYGLYNVNMWSSTYGCKIQRSGSSGHYTYSVASDYANRPVNWVSWGDAARFCNWMQNGQPTGAQGLSTTEDGAYYLNGATSQSALMAVTRKPDAVWAIPTEDEWYKAAYYDPGKAGGGGYWDYPTRSDSAPGRDMSEQTNPGNNANGMLGPDSPVPIDSGIYYTTVTGEFQLSHSPYGTFDQGGNVWEWNETVFANSTRGWRGGSFYYDHSHMAASERSYNFDPRTEDYSLGFRVATIPECVQPPAGDLNGDCKVDFQDLAIMAGQWLDCGMEPSSACNQ